MNKNARHDPSRCLVVSENTAIQHFIKSAATKNGFTVDTVGQVESLEQFCEVLSPGIVVVDLQFVAVHGFSVFWSFLRQRSKSDILFFGDFNQRFVRNATKIAAACGMNVVGVVPSTTSADMIRKLIRSCPRRGDDTQ